MSFDQSFKNLLPWEGGFTDDPRDPGGATNLGVIQEEYNRYRAEHGKAQRSVRYIEMSEAEDIYRTEYWQPMACEQLNPGVANCLFDAGVNSGTGRAVRWLQRAINAAHGSAVVSVDGACGPLTVDAASQLHPTEIISAMLAIRLAFMKAAINPHTGARLWPVFGGGWAARIHGVRDQSLALASKGSA